jgi:hypothetical protein
MGIPWSPLHAHQEDTMFGSLLLISALSLSPSQVGAMALTNIRATYGELGATRPEGKFLPGDVLFVGFDIENIVISEEGQVVYEMAMEVLDKNNKPIFKQDPAKKTDFVPLGGTKLPARAFITIGLDQEPGTYTMKLSVTDLAKSAAKNNTKTFTKNFEVTKREFGIVAVYTSVDDRGNIAAPTSGQVGQSVFVQFGVVNFERKVPPVDPKAPKPAKDAKPTPPQPDVTFEMVTLDARGKPTLGKPIQYKLTSEVSEKDQSFSMRFLLPMTRAGKYTVRLKATDNHTKKESTFDLPISVIEPGS